MGGSSLQTDRITLASNFTRKGGRFKNHILMDIKEFGFALIITNFRYFRGFGWFLLRLFEMQSLLT